MPIDSSIRKSLHKVKRDRKQDENKVMKLAVIKNTTDRELANKCQPQCAELEATEFADASQRRVRGRTELADTSRRRARWGTVSHTSATIRTTPATM